MIFRKLHNTNELLVVKTNRSDKRFLKNTKSDKYFSAQLKEKSKFDFYKLNENGEVVVDAERTLEKEEELQKEFFTKKIDELIEKKAIALGFKKFSNIGSYLTEKPNALKPNAEALGAWAGNVWGAVISIEQQVKDGDMEAPTSWEELEALLPLFGA